MDKSSIIALLTGLLLLIVAGAVFVITGPKAAAVDAAAAREHQGHRSGADGGDELQRAPHVDVLVEERVGEALAHACPRGEVHDRVGAAERLADRLSVPQIAMHEPDGQPGEVLLLHLNGVGVVKVVEDRDRPTRAQQRPTEVTADEAGAAGDQDPHVPPRCDQRAAGPLSVW